ncbi:MAG: adenylate kinase, partial [Actinobacteria bacterium]|nr:adenylate kinase [Actinomycetota bacterium]
MRLILVGPPGAGKGTQAVQLAKHYKIPHISTGDIFRANLKGGTDLGKLAKSYMDKGELVPDSVTNEMVRDRFKQPDVHSGFLLDGFPRNILQAEELSKILNESNLKLDFVLELQIENSEIVRRLSGRRTCKECGAIFHIEFDQPKIENKCDKCGGALYQREDDKESVVMNRLEVYAEQTKPIIDYYRKFGLLKQMS